MKYRFILTAASTIAIASLQSANTSHAETRIIDIPLCDKIPMTFQQASDAIRSEYPNGWTKTNNPLDPMFTGFFGKTKSGHMFIIWNGNGNDAEPALTPATLTFLDYEGKGAFQFGPGTSTVVLDNNGTYMTGIINGSFGLDELGCVKSAVGKVAYSSSWTGHRYNNPAYVAMGDSFSSGEGNPAFEVGTNTSTNKCHRSSDAYARLLGKDSVLGLRTTAFVACSGATTEDVLNGKYGEPPQVDALSKDTKVVTLTIGGNDIGFSKFAAECVTYTCHIGSKPYSDAIFMINTNLPQRLTYVLDAIAKRTSGAKVYVMGYPYVTPEKTPINMPKTCAYLKTPKPGLDSEGANAVTYILNVAIKNTVNKYVNKQSTTKFTFVSANASPHGSFNGHDICQGSNSYFHNVTPGDITSDKNRPYIFHPNKAGQNEYYKIVKGAMLAK